METHFLPYRNSTIHYQKRGTGPEWLFCFHGYGELGSSFRVFETLLGHTYTLISIDFPYHGDTDWQEGLLFDISDLIQIIDLIKPKDRLFSIMGYSMGGRVALQILQTIPHQIKKLVLIAPDGLHKNIWQWLSTKTTLGNRIFDFTMCNPNWIMRLLPFAVKLGLFNKNRLKFVHYYLDDAEQRSLLFKRWTTMRKFSPNAALVKQSILKNKISVNLVFGKYDRIILAKHGFHFSKNVEIFVTVTQLEAGHQLLKEKYAIQIAELFFEKEPT